MNYTLIDYVIFITFLYGCVSVVYDSFRVLFKFLKNKKVSKKQKDDVTC